MKSLRFYGKIVTEYKRRENMKRSMYAGRVREEHIGQEITLKGWVARRRDLGGLILSTFVTVKESCSWLSTLKKYQQR